MRALLALLAAVLLWFQWQIWVAQPNVADARRLAAEIEAQRAENARLRERNAALEAEVRDLKQGSEAVEERARTELGMVKRDETFYQVIEEPAPPEARETAAPPAGQGGHDDGGPA
jgi:cell division protein FtsB